MSSEDGQVDYSRFSREELLEARATIDQRQYPINFANLSKTLEQKGPAPEPTNFGFQGQTTSKFSFSVEPRDHWRHLWVGIFIFFGMMVATPAYTTYEIGPDTIPGAMAFAAVGFLLLIFLPHMAIHRRHILINKGASITIDGESQEIVIETDDSQLRIAFAAVKRLDVVKGLAFFQGGGAMFPWQKYSYAKLRFGDANNVAISSLLVPVEFWEDKFSGCETQKSPFPLPPKSMAFASIAKRRSQ
jgi:hypothetical protein